MNQIKLKKIAKKFASKILNASENNNYFKDPYQHIVLDDVFEIDFVNAISESFPSLEDPSWQHSNDKGIEIKSRSNWSSDFDIPDGILPIIRVFNSSFILDAMSKKLSIPKLIPDPYFTGGGLNVTEKGGLLDVHVDGNYHDATGLNRRVNLLLYLNEGWEESWGGQFGIYTDEGNTLVKKIPPLFNRCVIFDTHDKSYHGLPDAINFPQDKPRKSIILYYYTVEPRPSSNVVVNKPHSALWKSKSFNDKKGNKTRKFK
ncbi:2OG-Fe(II) oxygenase [Gammaproteobacteria bacterium]|nr:2OG-Fe(II) oxygenase [Gammaproteobacteria bacterium]MDA9575294.1 2OG-Fe(II) oxygenase [Gammaproteobacteria bacterium]MDC3411146.1 2OG-Fe(II) oxygenase [Gammaproteobacteria bacterium]